MLLPVSIIEITRKGRVEIEALLSREDGDPATERWIMFIERGPMGNVTTATETELVERRHQHIGPKFPYSGLLIVYRRLPAWIKEANPIIREITSACEREMQMRAQVALGRFNSVSMPARAKSVRSSVHVALMT